MEQRLRLGQWPAPRVLVGVSDSLRLGLAAGLTVLLVVYLSLGLAFLRALPSPAVHLAVSNGGGSLLDAPLGLQTIGWGTSISEIRLTELLLDEQDQVVEQREVPVRYQPVSEGRIPGETQGVLARPDGGPLLAFDARYEVTVRGRGTEWSWLGPHSVPLLTQSTFTTARTPRPQFEGDSALQYGEPLAIRWSTPIAEFRYSVRPEVPTRSWLSDDGQVAYIALEEFQQATSYQIEVTEARATTGAPLPHAATANYTTPAALRVTGFTPADGARDVAPGEDPSITFSAPVANPEAAAEAIVVEPTVAGEFRWLAPNRVQFVTDKGFPYSTGIRLTVQPGPAGLRSVDGGFIEDEAILAYRTRVHKRIDVDLSAQRVTLLEDGRVVYTTAASTGVRGAETPVGSYTIRYKTAKARFRGTNPSGHTYDIPDVPWVMEFLGDYTFHGAPWRQAYGVPLSNGCVSLPAPADKYIYDWTPVGTPVTIHY